MHGKNLKVKSDKNFRAFSYLQKGPKRDTIWPKSLKKQLWWYTLKRLANKHYLRVFAPPLKKRSLKIKLTFRDQTWTVPEHA